MKKVGIILPTEFRRLGPHLGGMYRWFEAEREGMLPKPDAIIGCSAGAIIGANCFPWTEENFHRKAQVIRDLKMSQIFTLPLSVETSAVLVAGASLFPFIDLRRDSGAKRLLFHTGEVATSLLIEAFALRQFLKRPSIFSNEPLRKLLFEILDFKAIFESETRLEVLATNMVTGESVVFCNHNKCDQDPARFVKAIMASARLPGRFPPIAIDGVPLGDAGVLGYAPLENAVACGCEVIVFFLYSPLKEAKPVPADFLEDIVTTAQITEAMVTRLKVEAYQDRLKRGENLPPLFIIEASRPLHEMTFRSFNSEMLVDSMNMGYEAVDASLPALRKLVA